MASTKSKREHLEESSCIGSQYFAKKDTKHRRRIPWLVAYLICAGFMLYFISKNFTRYFSYPASSNFEYIHVNSLEFPALTICNKNGIRKSYYDLGVEDGTIPAVFGSREDYIKQQARLGHKLLQGLPINSNTTTEEIYKMLLPNVSGILSDEHYNTREKVRYQERLYMEGGHQFEDTVLLSLMNEREESCAVYNGREVYCNVSSALDEELCHTITFTDVNGTALRSNRLDEYQVIYLTLDPKGEEYLPINKDLTPGLYVGIHPRNEAPSYSPLLVFEEGHGFNVYLEKSEISVLGLPYSEQDCIDMESADFVSPLRYYRNYSYSYHTCWKECKGEIMMEACGCREFGFPDFALPVCNYSQQVTCLKHQSFSQCTRCLSPCHQTKYRATPVRWSWHTPNTVWVTMQFSNEAYTKITQSKEFPAEELFAEVGGHLGLFLGASVLTIAEFVDLFCVLFNKQ